MHLQKHQCAGVRHSAGVDSRIAIGKEARACDWLQSERGDIWQDALALLVGQRHVAELETGRASHATFCSKLATLLFNRLPPPILSVLFLYSPPAVQQTWVSLSPGSSLVSLARRRCVCIAIDASATCN